MTPPLQIESVHLRVGDLTRSHEFYAGQLGFAVANEAPGRLELAAPAGGARLVLIEDRAARPAGRHAAGLFHAAVLLPSRGALGRWLETTAAREVSFEGFADHGVSEAIYLHDPEGNGLEFYFDRPREVWPRREGRLAMVTEPLDVSSLLAAGRGEAVSAQGAPSALAGAAWGHLHLRVTQLDRSEAFYSQVLGLQTTQRYGREARFLSAGGYHHHLGLNGWGGVDRPFPPGALGLAEATFSLASASGGRTTADPDGIPLRITPLAGAGARAKAAVATGSP